MPQEPMFLERFYRTQTLSTKKLQSSSFQDPMPEETVFTRFPELASYYLTRWREQNLITGSYKHAGDVDELDRDFCHNPEVLIEKIHASEITADR